MKPATFKEKTITFRLSKPDMTDKECSSLDVFCDGNQCISCWTPSFKERLSILFFGKVWLSVMLENTQPPVWIMGERTPFQKGPDKPLSGDSAASSGQEG